MSVDKNMDKIKEMSIQSIREKIIDIQYKAIKFVGNTSPVRMSCSKKTLDKLLVYIHPINIEKDGNVYKFFGIKMVIDDNLEFGIIWSYSGSRKTRIAGTNIGIEVEMIEIE